MTQSDKGAVREGRRRAASAVLALAAAALLATLAQNARAVDPPHGIAPTFSNCERCHVAHNSPGGTLNTQSGNANVCLSCHVPAGQAANRPFADGNQAVPGTAGTSHRWDSGPSGYVKRVSGNTSPGDIGSGGVFTGRIEDVYTITITTQGAAGTARFAYSSTYDGSGSNLLSGTGVALGTQGLTLTFTNLVGAPVSFLLNQQWQLRVRTDLRLPVLGVAGSFERPLAQRIMNGKVVCSTCHDQHSQSKTPFDASAPAYAGAGTGWTGTGVGRHFQRQDNNANQMCKICHSARDVSSSAQGSHPVGIPLPPGNFQTPPNLPLSAAGNVECMSCHAPHYADSGGANGGAGDGYLLRRSINDLCYQCHTNADRANGSHLSATTGALWPGGQYGSSFPAHTADKRGACVNCHWPHGWPDAAAPAQDYPRLWVERYDTASDRTDRDDAENLCYTCHDGAPAQSNIRADFLKGTNGTGTLQDIFHHPVKDSEQSAGRSVECVDCHNPHQASAADRIAGVAGVDIGGNPIAAGSRQLQQYELCFKCHGDTFNAARPMTSNKRLDFATGNSAYHPVVQAGRNQSANLASQLRGGLTTTSTLRCTDCHNSNAFSATVGKVVDSAAVTFGPHGSIYAPVLRANFNRNTTAGPASYSATNFTLCFNCHDAAKLVTSQSTPGAATNFYDTINGKANLHWVHLVDRVDKARATCQNCHFDIHGNQSASNTQYRINNTLYNDAAAVSTARIKTHMVNFSPDVTAIGGRAKPEWWLDTSTRERRCYLACHGATMAGETGSGGKKAQYRPASGDETVWNY